mmetsp:Transcript_11946/g.28174  ORF Transcript_11946/g.28174 Transcript_11946/m.28174 type:complete len:245 (-) Transcript_11946:959-1693(-)
MLLLEPCVARFVIVLQTLEATLPCIESFLQLTAPVANLPSFRVHLLGLLHPSPPPFKFGVLLLELNGKRLDPSAEHLLLLLKTGFLLGPLSVDLRELIVEVLRQIVVTQLVLADLGLAPLLGLGMLPLPFLMDGLLLGVVLLPRLADLLVELIEQTLDVCHFGRRVWSRFMAWRPGGTRSTDDAVQADAAIRYRRLAPLDLVRRCRCEILGGHVLIIDLGAISRGTVIEPDAHLPALPGRRLSR